MFSATRTGVAVFEIHTAPGRGVPTSAEEKMSFENWEGSINGMETAIFPSVALQENSWWQKFEHAASWCWILLPLAC